MRSQAVINITGKRALDILKGVCLWSAFVEAPTDTPEETRSREAWRDWLDTFTDREGVTDNEVFTFIEKISLAAHEASRTLSAHSTKV